MPTVQVMSYERYLEECFKVQAKWRSWRPGQTLFNVLSEQRPDLARRVNGTEFDPFYAETHTHAHVKISKFLAFVREHWDDDWNAKED